MTADTPDRLLNNSEAAELLSISPKTLVALRDKGVIPFVKILDHAKGVRYSERSLTQWIAEREQRSVAPMTRSAAKKRSKATL
jgi:predicted site-specific integrase-resolvase